MASKCEAVKSDGTPCNSWAMQDSKFCRKHIGPTKVVVSEPEGADRSGSLCETHFPQGWPEDSYHAGCSHGSFEREVAVDESADRSESE